MIKSTLLGTANIPNNGGELRLTQHENDFSIHLKGVRGELMNSRMRCSEIALAELGCAQIQGKENAKVLASSLDAAQRSAIREIQINIKTFPGFRFTSSRLPV